MKKGTPLWKALLFERRLPWRYKHFLDSTSKEAYNLLVRINPCFHKRYVINKRIIELNLTNYCNLSCINCEVSCRQAPGNDYMTLGQIKKFVKESIALSRRWKKIKLFGGEPTLHPQFFKVIQILKKYKKSNPYCNFQLLTNGTGKKVKSRLLRVPKWISIINSTEKGMVHKLKPFESYNIAPIDLKKYNNSNFSKGCWRIETCGICLGPSGYYVCAPAYHTDRVLGLDVGIKKLNGLRSPTFKNQLNILCRYCGLYKEPRDYVSEEKMSPFWIKAYEKYKKSKPILSKY